MVLLALVWPVTESATKVSAPVTVPHLLACVHKVRLVDCAGAARLHKFDFTNHATWDQALTAVRCSAAPACA